MKTIDIAGIKTSSLVLGTDYFGSALSRDNSFRLMDTYFAGGGRALDTARMYANWLPDGDGMSERTVAAWVSERGVREEMVVITKGGHGFKGDGGLGRLRREELELDMSESLENLGFAPDIYLLHRDNVNIPVEEIMETLHSFVCKGYTRAIGCSNWRADRIAAANAYAAAKGLTPFTSSEIQWSLAYSNGEMQGDPSLVCMDAAEYAFYEKTSMPVLAFSSQGKGFFARGASGEAQNSKAINRFDCPLNRERLARTVELAERRGISVTSAVLAYITSAPFPAAALIGCKKPEQLTDSLAAADVALTAEECAFLEGAERFPAL